MSLYYHTFTNVSIGDTLPSMQFNAQIKNVKRTSTASNDVEYSVQLITEQNLAELMPIMADELVQVTIEPYTQNAG